MTTTERLAARNAALARHNARLRGAVSEQLRLIEWLQRRLPDPPRSSIQAVRDQARRALVGGEPDER